MKRIRNFAGETRGVVAVEFALVFPIMLSMFLGAVDVGNAILIVRKLASATQTMADLITRQSTVTTANLSDDVTGAEMIMAPFSTATFGYDIAGIQYNATSGSPAVIWRKTYNMTASSTLPSAAAGLGSPGEGVVAVVMTYNYTPSFFGYVLGPLSFTETAIMRGRKTSFVTLGS